MQARTISRADPLCQLLPRMPRRARTATLTAYAAATIGRLMSCQSMPMRYAIPRPVQHWASRVHSQLSIRDWEGDAMRFLHDQGLPLTMFGIFAVTLVGLALTGWSDYNGEQADHSSHGHPHRVPQDAELRRGGVRELGERVPPDGRLRPANGLPVQPWILRVEATRKPSGAPGRRSTPVDTRKARALAGPPAA